MPTPTGPYRSSSPDPDTGEPVELNGVYEAEVRRHASDDDIVFTFQVDDGTMDLSQMAEGIIVLTATREQRADAFSARTYVGRIMRVDTHLPGV